MFKPLLLFLTLILSLSINSSSQSEYDIYKLRSEVKQKKSYYESLPLNFEDKSKSVINQRNRYNEIVRENNRTRKSNLRNKVICFTIAFFIGLLLSFKLKRIPRIKIIKRISLILMFLIVQSSSKSQNDYEFDRLTSISKNYDWAIEEREKDIEFKRKEIRDLGEAINKEAERNYELQNDTLLSLKNIVFTICFFLFGFILGFLILKIKNYKIEIR